MISLRFKFIKAKTFSKAWIVFKTIYSDTIQIQSLEVSRVEDILIKILDT